jgi:hypothetical protein
METQISLGKRVEAQTVTETNEEHSLLRFWKHAYARFHQPLEGGFGFHVPLFPNALLSPKFAVGRREAFLAANRQLPHFNEIVPLGHDQRGPAPLGFRLAKQFFLGERKVEARSLPEGFSLERMPLAAAIEIEGYWRLITDGFGGDTAFLRMLSPFLCTLEAEFVTTFLLEEGRRVGVVTVGLAGDSALVLNEVVDSRERGRGLSLVLSDVAQNLAFERGARHAFFWTEHAFFGRHADRVDHYRVFERV